METAAAVADDAGAVENLFAAAVPADEAAANRARAVVGARRGRDMAEVGKVQKDRLRHQVDAEAGGDVGLDCRHGPL